MFSTVQKTGDQAAGPSTLGLRLSDGGEAGHGLLHGVLGLQEV